MRVNVSIVAGIILCTACQSSTAPFADLRVVTSVGASGVPAAPFMISTTVTNKSNRAFSLSTKTCPSTFRVETVTGVVLTAGEQICTMEARGTSLAPGESYQLNELWSGKGADGAPLIGTYRVVGQPFRTAGPQSAPVTIELPR